MRGYIPLSNPLSSIAAQFQIEMPSYFTECSTLCKWLSNYAGPTGLEYFQCYGYGFSNNENMAGDTYTSDYLNCSCMCSMYCT